MDHSPPNHRSDESAERRDIESGFGTFARLYRDAAPYLALGVQLAATVVIMFYAGKWADEYFGTAPWLMIVGLAVGAVAGFYNFFKTVIDLGTKDSSPETRGSSYESERRKDSHRVEVQSDRQSGEPVGPSGRPQGTRRGKK
jgi:F0F1-type ATP synthase assembly protein I